MNSEETKRILIVAGEVSGDMHAANLVQQVAKNASNITFYGMGGELMQKCGVNIIVDANKLSIFGGAEIITKFMTIWRTFRTLKAALFNDKPDLLILVDYPGFNLRLAKVAKKAGVKVLYFISPKVWAWHQSRIKIIKKYVDMMAVIFPFEVSFYQKWQIPAAFVGNPLLQLTAAQKISQTAAREAFKLDAKHKIIGLFPGSRQSEIKRLLPIMLDTAKILKKQNPNIHFLLSQASSITPEDINPFLQLNQIKIQIIPGQNYQVMCACDAIIAASGTATLEIALMAIPLVIIYKMSWWEYQLAKRLIKIPYVGLCNILANKKIVPELLQNEANPSKIATEITKILDNNAYHDTMINDLKNIKNLLESDKTEDIASLIMGLI